MGKHQPKRRLLNSGWGTSPSCRASRGRRSPQYVGQLVPDSQRPLAGLAQELMDLGVPKVELWERLRALASDDSCVLTLGSLGMPIWDCVELAGGEFLSELGEPFLDALSNAFRVHPASWALAMADRKVASDSLRKWGIGLPPVLALALGLREVASGPWPENLAISGECSLCDIVMPRRFPPGWQVQYSLYLNRIAGLETFPAPGPRCSSLVISQCPDFTGWEDPSDLCHGEALSLWDCSRFISLPGVDVEHLTIVDAPNLLDLPRDLRCRRQLQFTNTLSGLRHLELRDCPDIWLERLEGLESVGWVNPDFRPAFLNLSDCPRCVRVLELPGFLLGFSISDCPSFAELPEPLSAGVVSLKNLPRLVGGPLNRRRAAIRIENCPNLRE